MHRPSRIRRLVNRGLVLAVMVALGAGVPADGAAQDPAANPAQEVARLEAENAALDALVLLAGGKEFYLVLDPASPSLTLMLRGAELRRYALLGLEVGVPRVAFVRRHEPRPWQGVIWADGRLEPPREVDRLEIIAPAPGTSEAAAPETPPAIPPTPEEAYPVPSRYHVLFAGGPAIEIRPREADTSASRWSRVTAWWSARWRDTVAALRATPDDLVRLRVVLSPEDAGSLYRSLPPGTKLLVLSGGGAGGMAPR